MHEGRTKINDVQTQSAAYQKYSNISKVQLKDRHQFSLVLVTVVETVYSKGISKSMK